MNAKVRHTLLEVFGERDRVPNSVAGEHVSSLRVMVRRRLVRVDGGDLVLTDEGAAEREVARSEKRAGRGLGSRGGMRLTDLNRWSLDQMFKGHDRIANQVDAGEASVLRRAMKLGVVELSPNKREVLLTEAGRKVLGYPARDRRRGRR